MAKNRNKNKPKNPAPETDPVEDVKVDDVPETDPTADAPTTDTATPDDAPAPLDTDGQLEKLLSNALDAFTEKLASSAPTSPSDKNYAHSSLHSSLVAGLSKASDEGFVTLWKLLVAAVDGNSKDGEAFHPLNVFAGTNGANGVPVVPDSYNDLINVAMLEVEKGKDEVSTYTDLTRLAENVPSPIGSRLNSYYSN